MVRNLVLVVLDTLRADAIDPAIWRSIFPTVQVMGTMIASSPLTPPSHLALLQGQEPWEYFRHIGNRATTPRPSSLAVIWNRQGGESVAFSANPVVAPASVLQGFQEYNPGLPRLLPIALLEGMGMSDVTLALSFRALVPRGLPDRRSKRSGLPTSASLA